MDLSNIDIGLKILIALLGSIVGYGSVFTIVILLLVKYDVDVFNLK